jgi:FkbM family methyltransferase
MLAILKHLLLASPLGPFAVRVHRILLAWRASELEGRNARYDLQTLRVMERVLQRDSSCIDIGAHQGSILAEMLRLAPDGVHHAFEPLPHLATQLRQRFPSVTVHELALSDHVGMAEFIYVENAPGYSGLKVRIYDRVDPVLERIMVNVARLDDVIPDHQAVTFIKLDIEGGEFHALLGGAETIRRCQPIIVLEAGQKSTGQYDVGPDDLYDLITHTLGYELSTMARWLDSQASYSREEFHANWQEGGDYYFIAFPATS